MSSFNLPASNVVLAILTPYQHALAMVLEYLGEEAWAEKRKTSLDTFVLARDSGGPGMWQCK